MKRVQPFADRLLVIVGTRNELRPIAIANEIVLGRSRFQVVNRTALWARSAQHDPFHDNVIRDQQLQNPQVYNYGKRGRGIELRDGMVLAIEPMLCEIGPKLRSRVERAGNNGAIEDVRTDSDRWTARTLDGTLAAHFEHSVAITGNGPMVLGK